MNMQINVRGYGDFWLSRSLLSEYNTHRDLFYFSGSINKVLVKLNAFIEESCQDLKLEF